jgi:hypothetical protein
MVHHHGSEYQVKIVHEDGTEILSGWMNSEERVVEAVAASPRVQGKAYLLPERNILCPACSNIGHRILEYPVTDKRSPRCSPHRSRYLRAMGT